MMRKFSTYIRISFGILFLLFSQNFKAQEQMMKLKANDIETRTTMYGLGYTNIFDTYLTPKSYKGIEFRVVRENMKMTNLGNGNISSQTFFQTYIGYTDNNVQNNNMFNGLLNWKYGLHYQFRLTHNFKLLAGGLIDANAGFVYNLKNSNNPASAKAYIDLDASAMAIWKLKINKSPITLRYQINIPVIGLMFSPNYNQSYYEIFTLGNASNTIKVTSINNHFSPFQMLSADVNIWKHRVRFAYIMDIQQSHINKIETHTYSHSFMIGVVKNLYQIGNKKVSKIPHNIMAY